MNQDLLSVSFATRVSFTLLTSDKGGEIRVWPLKIEFSNFGDGILE